jgi:hypothetical protein
VPVQLTSASPNDIPSSLQAGPAELRFRDKVADALHNDATGSTDLDALQFTGAQKFVDSAPTDIEDAGGTLDGDGQSVIKIDEMNVPTLAHDDKNRRRLFLKQSARQNWCGDFSAMFFVVRG